MLSSLWRQSHDIPSVKRAEIVSFDDFLASGSTLAKDFVWDMDRAKSISVRSIRDWRATYEDSISSPLDGMVLERRTNLWKVVCLSETFTSPDDSMTASFMMPVALGSHKSPYIIRAGDDMASSRLQSPLQRIHISPFAIPSTLADTRVSSAKEKLTHLNSIFDTSVLWTSELEEHFVRCVPMDWDLGTAYGHLRPWWAGYASGEYSFWEMDALMGDRRVEDMRLRHREVLEPTRWGKPGSFRIRRHTEERIANTQIPPRRVWDLYSNRVVPFSVLRCGATSVPDNVWAVSHSWVKPAERRDVLTAVNGKHWPVPLPTDVSLDQVRIELLNMGAEYVFLDVLCLRQQGDEAMEEIRQEEWELDVPTLGYVYRHNRYQTVVVYFNALGRPFCPRRDLLDSPLHWFNRAWTLQETSINWLPGGLTASSCAEWDGKHFMARMREAQMDLCLHTLPAETPQFAGILRAMQRRTGYADKKPYDRVAALAYLLPGHTPEVYVERWANAEEA